MAILHLVELLSGDRDCIRGVCSFFGIVLVAYCCYKKLPQIWWITTTYLYSLAVIKMRCLKSVCLGQIQEVNRAALPLEALRENPCPALPTSGGCWHPWPHGCITPITVSTVMWPSLLRCEISLCLTFETEKELTEIVKNSLVVSGFLT